MRRFLIKVNGVRYEVDVEEIGSTGSTMQPTAARKTAPAPASAPVPKAAAKAEAAVPAGAVKVTSPMPGTILKVNVKTGDAVKKGQVLLILEAMKMENEVVAPSDGTVVAVSVEKGASVNAGEGLLLIA